MFHHSRRRGSIMALCNQRRMPAGLQVRAPFHPKGRSAFSMAPRASGSSAIVPLVPRRRTPLKGISTRHGECRREYSNTGALQRRTAPDSPLSGARSHHLRRRGPLTTPSRAANADGTTWSSWFEPRALRQAERSRAGVEVSSPFVAAPARPDLERCGECRRNYMAIPHVMRVRVPSGPPKGRVVGYGLESDEVKNG